MDARASSPRPLLAWCAAGVALRLVFLFAARGIELVADEGFYVHSALTWNLLEFYSDGYRYLWPPGQPFYLARCLALFGEDGLFAARLGQVLASAAIGLSTMLLARRVFGHHAVHAAGAIWCFYLPLIGFTHTLWTESLFLAVFSPVPLLLLASVDDARAGRRMRQDAKLLAAGLLMALALYLKEAPILLVPVFAVALCMLLARAAPAERWRAPSLFFLTVAVAVLPWTLRNAEVYGRFVPVGSSLGENAYRGLNAHYNNFDLSLAASALRRAGELEGSLGRGWFTAPGDAQPWQRPLEVMNTADRQREGVRRGVVFAARHPELLVRSRIKKLADLVSPLSFFLRHLALGAYAEGPLGADAVRRPLAVWALLCPLLLLPLALAGLCTTLRDGPARALIGCVLVYFVSTSLLVSMSRFRVPLLPFAIVLAAGFLVHGPRRRGAARLATLAVSLAVLAVLWWIDLPELRALFALAWRGALA